MDQNRKKQIRVSLVIILISFIFICMHIPLFSAQPVFLELPEGPNYATSWRATVQPLQNDSYNWSIIYETSFHIMNQNTWKADCIFQFNITNISAFGIRIFTNETPPSENATVSLRDSNNTKIFHKEKVQMNQSMIVEGLWHIEYLSEGFIVKTNENYTFSLEIKKNLLTPDDEVELPIIGNDLHFKFGSLINDVTDEEIETNPFPTGGSQTPVTTIDDESNVDNETEDSWFKENCSVCYSIGGIVGIMGVVQIRKYQYTKDGPKRYTLPIRKEKIQ